MLAPARSHPLLYRPWDVAADRWGALYVIDLGEHLSNHRIKKLSAGGTLVATWGIDKPGPLRFPSPQGIAVDSQGNIYVVDGVDKDIVKLSASGQLLTRWNADLSPKGLRPGYAGVRMQPASVAVDTHRNLFVLYKYADWPDPFGGWVSAAEVVKFSPTHKRLATWSTKLPPADGTGGRSPVRITTGPGDTVYVSTYEVSGCGSHKNCDREAVVVYKLSPALKLLARTVIHMTDGGFMDAGRGGVVVDKRGALYDEHSGSIEKLSPRGVVLAQWPMSRRGCRKDGSFGVGSMTLDRDGNIYAIVGDSAGAGIVKLSQRGVLLATWGGCPSTRQGTSMSSMGTQSTSSRRQVR
ncbi:MAG: hypothetical protein NVSMB52_14310 [Chloroflexota bacterium]